MRWEAQDLEVRSIGSNQQVRLCVYQCTQGQMEEPKSANKGNLSVANGEYEYQVEANAD